MYQGLLHLHNLGRWVVLILLVIAIINAFAGMRRNEPFSPGDKKIGLFLMISAHLMLLIGLFQWFTSSTWGLSAINSLGMGTVMKDKVFRFFTIEHPIGNLIAITLITIGRAQSKKNIPDRVKHKKSFWMYLVALIILIATIPWPFREVARPLLPGGDI